MSVYNFVSSGNPMLDAARKQRFDQNLAMQGGNPMLIGAQAQQEQIDVQPVPSPIPISDNPMLSQPSMPMAQSVPSNPMFQPSNLMEAISAGVAAPQGQAPLGDYVENNWMNLLQSGLKGLEDNAMRANLPADTYLKIKSVENEKEIAAQNNFLQNLKMQAEVEYQQKDLELRREQLAQKRQEILMGGSGSSYMQDAKMLMDNDTSLNLGEAYAMARSGLPRGVVYNPSTGGVEEIGGFSDVTANIAGRTAEEEQRRKDQAAMFVRGQEDLPTVISRANRFEQDTQNTRADIESLKSRANSMTTGWTGNLVSAVAGTEAYNLAQDLNSVIAKAGFDALLELKDAGGSLGQIAVAELQALQSSQANLINSQSKEQFIRNLDKFMERREQAAQRLKNSAERDKGLYGGRFDDFSKAVDTGMKGFLENQSSGQGINDIDAEIRALERELGVAP